MRAEPGGVGRKEKSASPWIYRRSWPREKARAMSGGRRCSISNRWPPPLPTTLDRVLTEYSQLEKKAEEASDRFHALSGQIKQTETALKANAELKAATVQYAKTRPVFDKYKASKYSRKFLAEHEADIELYRAAQADMRRLLGGQNSRRWRRRKRKGESWSQRKSGSMGNTRKPAVICRRS